MQTKTVEVLQRREFLKQTSLLGAATGALLTTSRTSGAVPANQLEAGEGTVDITPPVGTLMSGFHYSPGNERRIAGVRQPTAARALVLRQGQTEVAILSVDLLAVSREVARRIQQGVQRKTGIPAENVRVTATHSHSTPTARYLRQWGGKPEEYIADVEQSCVLAVERARADLTAAELYLGKSVAEGANFNRTTKSWKTEDQFTAAATDAERWLDRTVHVLRFERSGGAKSLLWYHFSAHPVCFTDRQASPDWPGLVADSVLQREQITPSFLQGHIGDVNPGDGTPWLGNAERTAARLSDAMLRAMGNARQVEFDQINMRSVATELPLDLALHQAHVERYAQDPEKHSGGEYVDAAFAKDWYASASKWDPERKGLPTDISVLSLGDLALLFHAAELFSYYGLRIRHDSPFEDTILVGYADGMIGYLTDPASHENRDYAAAVVPKILDLPPFTPTATREFTAAAVAALQAAAS